MNILTFYSRNLLADLFVNRKILSKPHEDEHQYLNKVAIILFYLKKKQKKPQKPNEENVFDSDTA